MLRGKTQTKVEEREGAKHAISANPLVWIFVILTIVGSLSSIAQLLPKNEDIYVGAGICNPHKIYELQPGEEIVVSPLTSANTFRVMLLREDTYGPRIVSETRLSRNRPARVPHLFEDLDIVPTDYVWTSFSITADASTDGGKGISTLLNLEANKALIEMGFSDEMRAILDSVGNGTGWKTFRECMSNREEREEGLLFFFFPDNRHFTKEDFIDESK